MWWSSRWSRVDASKTAEARALLQRAAAHAGGVCVFTGAGMSAESGIPTFRDALTGLWARFDPTEMASEEGFRANPQRVWDWYAERRDGVRKAKPNAGHRALAGFAIAHRGAVVLVTQNVDDLHQRAGSTDTIRLHGDILQDRWLESGACGGGCVALPGRPPACACGNLMRPGVVWFGEMLPEAAIEAAQHAARCCRVLLVVGTSGAVWPAAGLAELARRSGAQVIIVNPADSEIDAQAHVVLRGTAALLLPVLLDA